MAMKESLETWFTKRPRWVQTAVALRVAKQSLTDQDYEGLLALCLHEATNAPTTTKFQKIPTGALDGAQAASALRLKRIESVKGVNALKSPKPLEFGDTPLTVIYGLTGTGKSSYSRLLRHACGARFSSTLELHPDAFDAAEVDQSAKLVAQVGDSELEFDWNRKTGPVPTLKGVHVFDSARAIGYFERPNEPTYEPLVLQLFSAIIRDCGRVESRLDQLRAQRPCLLPNCPPHLAGTKCASWYGSLTATTPKQSVATYCSFSEAMKQELAALNLSLNAVDPKGLVADRNRKRSRITALRESLAGLATALSVEAGNHIRTLRTTANEKKAAAKQLAASLIKIAPLSGVASDTWHAMWEAARTFSNEEAYVDKSFPYTENGALCVLCQQLLKDGAARLNAFAKYVSDAADAAATALGAAIEIVPKVPELEGLQAQFEAVGTFLTDVGELREQILKRRTWVVDVVAGDAPPLEIAHALAELDAWFNIYGADIQQMADLEKDVNQKAARARFLELQGQEWLTQHKSAVEAEIVRLVWRSGIGAAVKLTETNALTMKKNALSEELLAEAHLKRFQAELENLGGSRIPIIVKHEKAGKELKPGFALALEEAKRKVPVSQVLSDGEIRVVALASFLGDVTAGPANVPFVFDDPISSLDVEYEIATAKRLVKETQHRQVIVFTHRLSLLAAITEAAEKANVPITPIALRTDGNAKGIPTETFLNAKNPKTALQSLRDVKSPAAKKLHDAGDFEKYDDAVRAICSHLRILIERLIEKELLNDVVSRFRNNLITNKRLEKLVVIRKEDCQLLEQMMSDYSFPLHSQPDEAPEALPSLAQITSDVDKLIAWQAEYSKRK